MYLMIHSARPTVPPVAIIIFTWKLFSFARFRKVTDGWNVKIVIITGRDGGSASWINYF